MEQKNLIIGFEFNPKESQICYFDRAAKDAVSAEIKVGSSQYTFPTVLSKSLGKNDWHFGLEAEYFAEHQNGILIDQLYDLCANGNSTVIDGQDYESGVLLAIYLKNALKMLGVTDPEKQVSGMMITVPSLTRSFVEAIRYAYEKIGMPKTRCFLQDFDESFYYYALYQKQELWGRNVALFSFNDNEVTFSSLELDHRTKPVTATVTSGKTKKLSMESKKRDDDFYRLIEESFGKDIYSSVFLIGEGFDKNWAVRSVALLCRNRRHVFYGNNLYAKGACFAVYEKVEERKLKGYLFVGNALIRHNIGMDMSINGSPAYYAMIGAGVNWYEASKDCELILDHEEELTFVVSSMEDGRRERYTMPLPDLPERPNKTTRLRLHLEYDSPKRCQITVEDMGFGEMFPSGGKVWHETMEG
ncbi:MAG TPA: hypothetical protein IAC62_00510 [Candidatus Pelethocola excrementipullorum]|nr:hypothetical protein [Candidatus Pelethocola excrementipullorum]